MQSIRARNLTRRASCGLFAVVALSSCGEPLPPRPDDLSGEAVLELRMLSVPLSEGTDSPPDAFPGFTGIPMDLNDSTGGDYVWLYYRMGPADGSQGDPVSEIYTVDSTDGEGLKSGVDTSLMVNTNNNAFYSDANRIYIAFATADWPVVRGIAVANYDLSETRAHYAPPGVEATYPIVWSQQRAYHRVIDHDGQWGPNPQDLNEGTSGIFTGVTDYIYIGYMVDQEIYDWIQRQQ